MSGNNNDGKGFDPHESGWVNVDLGPRQVDLESNRTEAVVIGQFPGWTNFDLEGKAPAKKRLWLHKRKSKVVVGIAIVLMLLVGIIVPTVVAIRNKKDERIG